MSTDIETHIPRHVGYILDGNRRWAKAHGLPVYEGHLAGYSALRDVIEATFEAGVEYASIYAFSTENWKRSEDEVQKLMGLILGHFRADLPMFIKNDVKVRILGSRAGLSEKIVQALEEAEARTAHGARGTLAVCFNYGGQLEIADACRRIIEAGTPTDDITPEVIAKYLYAPEVPPIDIVVRTSGEQRLSNFMLWRAAYSEFCFLDKPWPDMTKEDVTAILKEYSQRNRRFGG
jgi:undecaprenyl diphosphate synthase